VALPPTATNEAFLREVDEELRRDQLAGFWERYGRWVIAAVAAGLAVFAAYLYWQHRREQAAGVEGERLQAAYDALASGQAAAAAGQLDALAKSDASGTRALALFAQADAALQRGDTRAAAAKLAAVAGDGGIAKPFRDLALVRQTAAEYDALAPAEVIRRLSALAVPGNAYFGSAGELVALAHLRAGRRDRAGQLLAQVAKDSNVPATIRQRAVQMAGDTGVDAVQQPGAPGADIGSDAAPTTSGQAR